jgi:hypothetical protein
MAKKSRGGRMKAAKARAAKAPGGKGLVKNRLAGKTIMKTCGARDLLRQRKDSRNLPLDSQGKRK